MAISEKELIARNHLRGYPALAAGRQTLASISDQSYSAHQGAVE